MPASKGRRCRFSGFARIRIAPSRPIFVQAALLEPAEGAEHARADPKEDSNAPPGIGVNGPAQISIADAGGSTVRTFKGPARRGINRVTWDLRLEPPVPAAEQPAAPGFAGPPPGPTVLPGKYNVSVMLPSGRTLTGQLVVELDPRLHVADADRRVRQTSLLKLYELEKATAAARDAARGALDRAALARSASEGSALTRLQSDLTTMLNTAANLTRAIDGYSGAPTADQRRQIEWIFDDATKTIGELNRVLNADSRPPIVLPRRP